eukprot:12799266-Alexandrium_andersonii.AAC.1
MRATPWWQSRIVTAPPLPLPPSRSVLLEPARNLACVDRQQVTPSAPINGPPPVPKLTRPYPPRPPDPQLRDE